MSRFSFIHTSDIHLGSLLHIEGIEDTPYGSWSREATYAAFDKVCSLAEDAGARFIVIAGDLYDNEARSVKANRYFYEACCRLNEIGIEVFVLAGNHDPIKERQELFSLPPNVHIFSSSEPEVYYVPASGNHASKSLYDNSGNVLARIIGQSYQNKWEGKALHKDYPALDRDIFNLAMLHTQLTPGDKKYIPSSIRELIENSSIDYWALGHIHQPSLLNEGKPVIAYSGIPQGRDFGEENPGGCWLVNVDGTEISDMQFIVTSPIIFKRIEIDISGKGLQDADGINLLEDYIATQAQDLLKSDTGIDKLEKGCIVEGYAVQWIITGRGDLHYYLNNDGQEDEAVLCQALRKKLSGISPFIWTDSVVIRTGSPASESILEDHGILKELLNDSINVCLDDEQVKNRLINQLGQAWSVALDHEDQDELKLTLDHETLLAIIDDAKQLLLEGLLERSE